MPNAPVIVGASGNIGRAVVREFSQRGERVFTASRSRSAHHKYQHWHLDLASPSSFRNLKISEVSHLIFCAGVSGFRECDSQPQQSYQINVKALKPIVEFCKQSGIPITLISSNSVFNEEQLAANEETMPSPKSTYGKQKAAQEQLVLAYTNGRVIRVTKVMSLKTGVLRLWRDKLAKGEEILAFVDRYVSPLSRKTVAKFIVDDIGVGATGVRHLTSDNSLSYYDLALRLCAHVNVARCVQPVSAASFCDPMPRLPTLKCDGEFSHQVSTDREMDLILEGL